MLLNSQSSRFSRRAEVFANPDDSLARKLAKETSLPIILTKLFIQRGISSKEEIDAFLRPTLKDNLPDPRLLPNSEAACELIIKTLREGKKITILCDFDVDGVTSGAQLFLFLQRLRADVNIYIPNRFKEGYGVSLAAVEKISAAGTALLICVDCGTTAKKEIEQITSLGVCTLVIDHHEAKEIATAEVVVNPAVSGGPFADYELCSSGLVWMLLVLLRSMLEERLPEYREILINPKQLLELACLGTICDMVPLRGLNRLIAIRGLEALRQTERPGLKALMEKAGINQEKVNSGHVGFALGPRINACGRLEDAKPAFEILITADSKRAAELAQRLDRLNKERKMVEEKVLHEACECLDTQDISSLSAITVFKEDFHQGVIGIAAQRLVEEFHRPAAVMSLARNSGHDEMQQTIRGSVRGIKGFHVADALNELRSLTISCGGHEGAGGFSLLPEKLDAFCFGFRAQAKKMLSLADLQPTLKADLEADFSVLDFITTKVIEQLAPFGCGNRAPLFVTKDVMVVAVYSVGDKHLRLRLQKGENNQHAVGWGFRGHPLLKKGEIINVSYTPEINSYQGVSAVQLNLKAVWQD